MKESSRQVVCLIEIISFLVGGIPSLGYIHPCLPGQRPDRLREGKPLLLHQEVKDTPPLSTAKTLVELFFLTYGKARGLFVVEGAETYIIFAPPVEGYVLADDNYNVCIPLDLFYLFSGYTYCQGHYQTKLSKILSIPQKKKKSRSALYQQKGSFQLMPLKKKMGWVLKHF